MFQSCSICGKLTEYCCSDCMINTRESIPVCENPKCRDKHEQLKNHKTY